MKGVFSKLRFNTVLLKITSLNGVAVILQILGGLVTSKLIAIYLGERGMAIMGYMRNFLTSTQAAGSLGFGSGVIALVAKQKKNSRNLSSLLSTAFFLSLGATFIISLLLFFGADYWNTFVFKATGNYTFIFKYLAIALPLITVNGLLVSYLNGLSHYKKIVWINIVTNLIGLILAISLIVYMGIKGALTALVIAPAIAIVVSLFFLLKHNEEAVHLAIQNIKRKQVRQLGSYTIMAVSSAIVLPIIFISIRQHITENAGYWDAMTRISVIKNNLSLFFAII